MGGYIANFSVYIMAMIGLIFFAIFVFKKLTDGSFGSGSAKYLSLEDTMTLSPRKTLHIVRAGQERFLIASDVDRTTLISKLEPSTKQENLNRFKNIESLEFPQTYDEILKNDSIKFPPIENRAPSTRSALDPRVAGGAIPQRTRQSARPRRNDIYAHSTMKDMAKRINEL